MGDDDKSKKKGDISDLFDLKIFGINIGDLLRNVDDVREKVLDQREELRKKLGDNIKVDFDVKVGGLVGERRISSGGGRWSDLVRERREWRKRVPTVKITKEDIKKAKEELKKEREELEKERQELEKAEKGLEKDGEDD